MTSKTKIINERIGERANLFMANADERDLTAEEIERTKNKRAEISEWVKKQSWFKGKK